MVGRAALAKELLSRRAARADPLSYAKYMMDNYVVGDHHRKICDLLARVERGESTRVIITAPPRHGKSQLVSRMFPAWYLGRNPDKQVIVSSYGQELASDFGREVRNSINSTEYRRVFPGVELDDASKAANRFHIRNGGVLYAVGVGGALSGRGFDVGVIDDPVKNREDADSALTRRSIWNWYTSTFYTRAMPDAAIIVMSTRWHEDDLVGRLLEAEKNGGEKWELLELPAIVGEHDEDSEEALWPEWYPLESLYRIRASIGPRDWSALYQQRPQSDDGSYFKREWFERYDPRDRPENLSLYITSDLAVTDGGGDYTVHTVWGVDTDGRLWCIACYRAQANPDAWVEALLRLAMQYRPLAWYCESGVIRRAVEPMLVRRQRETGVYFRTEWVPSVKDKPTRARSFQSRAATGGVFFPKAAWADAFIDELVMFPAGRHDDCVDTCSLIGSVSDRLVSASRAASPDGIMPRNDYGAGPGSVDFWRVA